MIAIKKGPSEGPQNANAVFDQFWMPSGHTVKLPLE
jgi:hypothetical protein